MSKEKEITERDKKRLKYEKENPKEIEERNENTDTNLRYTSILVEIEKLQ